MTIPKWKHNVPATDRAATISIYTEPTTFGVPDRANGDVRDYEGQVVYAVTLSYAGVEVELPESITDQLPELRRLIDRINEGEQP